MRESVEDPEGSGWCRLQTSCRHFTALVKPAGTAGATCCLHAGSGAEVTKRDHATAGVVAVYARTAGVETCECGAGEVNVLFLIVYVWKYTIGGRFLWRNAKLEVACRGLSVDGVITLNFCRVNFIYL